MKIRLVGLLRIYFIIELKQTHKQLSKNNDPVQQLKDYVIRIQNNKLNKEDGGRINTTPQQATMVSFYATYIANFLWMK